MSSFSLGSAPTPAAAWLIALSLRRHWRWISWSSSRQQTRAERRAAAGANAHYRRRREVGDWHAAAQRNLFNRMIGQLYHCLQHRKLFDEATAFPTERAAAA